MIKKRSISSYRWLSEHFRDQYVRKTHQKNLRSRSWFKLHDIDVKYHLFRTGMNVIDLGSSPGGWSEYAIKHVGKTGSVTSCDMNAMNKISGVFFLQGDISKKIIFNALLNHIQYKKINLVMSDMSPKITGISYTDMSNAFDLFNLAFKIAKITLSNKGIFLIKLFHGEEFENYLHNMYDFFNTIRICKPSSSRSRSKEVFLLAKKKKI
ncbi:RlmE family RNA methyltransferase [Buchnera aphidicola]|uniref:RlmE family RNA methyltransferase n=1 Tax=Buchnera aphidicola TaxID=9 RepID=UPI002238CA15|nr:rRNA methyltransferase [Buchnera aphidicola (Stegophylla sp.)]